MAISSPLDKSYDASQSPRFQQRVGLALLDTVVTVANESGATTNHTNRIAFAAQVVINPLRWAEMMGFGVIAVNSNIQTAITNASPTGDPAAGIADADIKAAVTVVWDFYSNAAATLVGTSGNKVI